MQIILPGLFDLPLDELDADFVTDKLPGLNRILGLSTTHQNQDFSIDALLSSALALRPTAGISTGIAAGIAADRADGLAMAQAFATDTDETARLLLAQAIHLQADMHGAIAVPISENAENKNDISKIIKDLSELFKVDCKLSEVTGGCYLLQLKAFDAPLHYPHPLSVLGKNINPFVEQSRQVLPWYQLINEFQMFMHQHPVNEKRQKMGRLPINSLWVWGAGVRPTIALQPAWYCDDPLLNQFAASLGLKVGPCSSVAASSDLEDAVVVDLRLLQLLKSGIDRSLDELLLDIEGELIAPVLQRITQRPQPLWLRAGYKLDFELKPGARFKFWRRPGSLYDWR